MKKITASLLILIAFVSCMKNDYYKVDKVKIIEPDSLMLNVLETEIVESDLIGMLDISVYDSLLVVMTSNPNNLFAIINTYRDDIILSTGSQGNGPNEYISPYLSKHYIVNPNGDLILDIRDNPVRHRPLNITQSIQRGHAVCEKDIIEDASHYTSFYINDSVAFTKTKTMLGNSSSSSSGSFTPSPLQPDFNYKNGDITTNFNVYPEVMENTNEPISAAYLYLGESIYIKPDATKVVDFSYFFDRFIIFNLGNNTTHSIERKGCLQISDFKGLTREGMMPIATANYYDAHLTDKYIITLHDGRSYYDLEKDIALEPTIRVFDWDGNLVKRYKIKEDVQKITYCEKTNYLYAIDLEDRLLKYKINIESI